MADKRKLHNVDDYVIRCPECKGQVVTDTDHGERHCEECGLVVDHDMVDTNVDYRNYDDEQSRERQRIGPPKTETMHDKGLTTEIDPSMRDSHGNPISSNMRREVHRLRKWQKKVSIKNSQERNLVFALTEISKKSSHLELTQDVKRETAHLYRRAVEESIIRGRSITAVIAASLYLASRICGQPRTLDEIAQGMDISRKECGRIARFMRRKFNLRLPPPTGDVFLERFTQFMHLDKPTLKRATDIMIFCRDIGMYSGKAPMGLVAAVIYTAVEEKYGQDEKMPMTQKDVAEQCSVTEVTLRNRYKDIRRLLDEALVANDVL